MSPVWEYVVVVVPVFDTRFENVPEPDFASILYPVIGEPPLFDGADQERFTWVGETGVADTPVGEPGAVNAEDDVGCTTTSFDGFSLVPNCVME